MFREIDLSLKSKARKPTPLFEEGLRLPWYYVPQIRSPTWARANSRPSPSPALCPPLCLAGLLPPLVRALLPPLPLSACVLPSRSAMPLIPSPVPLPAGLDPPGSTRPAQTQSSRSSLLRRLVHLLPSDSAPRPMAFLLWQAP